MRDDMPWAAGIHQSAQAGNMAGGLSLYHISANLFDAQYKMCHCRKRKINTVNPVIKRSYMVEKRGKCAIMKRKRERDGE